MRIISLSDDVQTEGLRCEHGLSFFIETSNHRIIADTGQSDATWENAGKLGVSVADADTVFVSHGHYDHTGGLKSLSALNKKARIYISRYAFGEYYSMRDTGLCYIGMDRTLDAEDYVLCGDSTEIDSELSVFSSILGRKYFPAGNARLFKKSEGGLLPDDFLHEQCLVVNENGRQVLFSGCAHNGIVNILDRFSEIYGCAPYAVVSGFHLKKNSGFTSGEKEEISGLAGYLRETGCMFYTSHCTGTEAFEIMRAVLGSRLVYIHAGENVEI